MKFLKINLWLKIFFFKIEFFSKGFRSRYSHDQEIAQPGYYFVYLEDPKINVEITSTKRSSAFRFNWVDMTSI